MSDMADPNTRSTSQRHRVSAYLEGDCHDRLRLLAALERLPVHAYLGRLVEAALDVESDRIARALGEPA